MHGHPNIKLLHLFSLAETQGHLSVPNAVATQADMQKPQISVYTLLMKTVGKRIRVF
jgi:hypothetical protein